MNPKDQRKICEAGFTIIKKQDTPRPIIKYKNRYTNYVWRYMQSDYHCKADRNRAMRDLLNSDNYVEE